MNQQEILKKIGGIIAELKDQYGYLEAAGDSFNDLELELFMANANFLTDHIEILKKIHGQAKTDAVTIPSSVLSAEKVYGQRPEIPDYFSEKEHLLYAENPVSVTIEDIPVIEVAESDSPEISLHKSITLPEVISQDEVKDYPVAEDASFSIVKMAEAEKPAEEVMLPKVEVIPEAIVQPEIKVQFETPPKPVNPVMLTQSNFVKQESEKPKDEAVLTLNQSIAAQRELDQAKVTAVESKNKTVQDLQSIISLNDKLLFVKELFNGYNLAYTEAINILNRYTTFEQARHFLDLNYTIKNNWKEKAAVSERFLNLLQKRFE